MGRKAASGVTSTTTKNDKTGVITRKYSDGRIVTDTPKNSPDGKPEPTGKYGFFRVDSADPDTSKTPRFLPPRLRAGGTAGAPVGKITIAKGTPIAALQAVIQDQLKQLETNGTPATSAYGSFNVF